MSRLKKYAYIAVILLCVSAFVYGNFIEPLKAAEINKMCVGIGLMLGIAWVMEATE